MRYAAAFLATTVVVALPGLSSGQPADRTPVFTTPHFAFYSDFATNLNDQLIEAGLARTGKSTKSELFKSGGQAPCFDKLPSSARAGWDRAVDYYAAIVSPAEWNQRQQYLLRLFLAGVTNFADDPRAREFVDIARGFMAAATPAYRACRWPAQDERNRTWVDALKPMLAAHEQSLATRLERLYGKPWAGLPIAIDIVETVNWAGATTTSLSPAGGHILISPSFEGTSALEIVFHEPSHLLMGPADPIRQALEQAGKAASIEVPPDLWHVVLFYTTGETVRRALEAAGKPGHRLLLHGIFDRGTWTAHRVPVETAWGPYLEGKRTLQEAARDLIHLLKRQ